MIGTPDYDESMNFVRSCICIENDSLHAFETLNEANEYKNILENDIRYAGRILKIVEAEDL